MASAQRMRRIEFKTGRIIRRGRGAMTTAIRRVARRMTNNVRLKISKPSPPVSRPGAHPHSDTGALRDTFEVVPNGFKMFIRVKQYGIYLEGGTRKMRARPFIRRNLLTPDKARFWIRQINTEIRKLTKKG